MKKTIAGMIVALSPMMCISARDRIDNFGLDEVISAPAMPVFDIMQESKDLSGMIDRFVDDFNALQENMDAAAAAMKSRVDAIEEQFRKRNDDIQAGSQSYVTIENAKKIKINNGYGFKVVVAMPGYSKESLQVSIAKDDNGHSVLKIRNKKRFNAEETLESGALKRSTESYSHETIKNNRYQKIVSENGNLEIVLSLPSTIDVQGAYDMKFDSETLTIVLPIAEKKAEEKPAEVGVKAQQ